MKAKPNVLSVTKCRVYLMTHLLAAGIQPGDRGSGLSPHWYCAHPKRHRKYVIVASTYVNVHSIPEVRMSDQTFAANFCERVVIPMLLYG